LRSCIASMGRWLAALSRLEVVALALCGVIGLGLADYLTGFELSLSVFYLIPMSIAAWYAGRRNGVAIAVLSSIVCAAADIGSGQHYSHPLLVLWNAAVLLAFYLSNVFVLAMLRERLAIEEVNARTDALTGLLNARAFTEILDHHLSLAQRIGSTLTLVYFDLDNFKSINDTYGHAEGDRVLGAMGCLFGESTRRSDIAARIGGDEFALLLPGTDASGAREIIAALMRRLSGQSGLCDRIVTCSIGAVTFRKTPTATGDALRVADRVMYEVKNNGKNGVAFHDWNERDTAAI